MRSKKLYTILGLMILAGSSAIQAQQGFGTNKPHPSAAVDITSTTQGFLPPRLNAADIKSFNGAVDGLVVYNTELQCLMYYSDGEFRAPFHRPVASRVSVDGVMQLGKQLTATYTYSQAESLGEGASICRWYYATDAVGTGKKPIANSPTYTISALMEPFSYIAVGVTPVTTTGKAGIEALSPWRMVIANTAPVFTSVTNTAVAATITFCATSDAQYFDYDDDIALPPTYQWYRFSNTTGGDKILISGATESTYTFTAKDEGMFIKVGITPKARSGVLFGTEQMASDYLGPVATTGCGTLKVTHTAGTVAPITKTVMYQTVSTDIGGTGTKCWITQNLGATCPAVDINDASDDAAGWYWQYNLSPGTKGMAIGGFYSAVYRLEDGDYSGDWIGTDHDPCSLLLGSKWQLPSKNEWNAAISAANLDHAKSIFKLHNAGYLFLPDGGHVQIFELKDRGTGMYVWVADRAGADTEHEGYIVNGSSTIKPLHVRNALPVRCITVD